VIVDVAGDVDFASSRLLEESLLSILNDKPRRTIVNLRDVPFMNTAGVAILVILLARAHKIGATVCLAALPACVRSVLEICRLETVFEIKDTRTMLTVVVGRII
jgi:anti-anti-sigma factor